MLLKCYSGGKAFLTIGWTLTIKIFVLLQKILNPLFAKIANLKSSGCDNQLLKPFESS